MTHPRAPVSELSRDFTREELAEMRGMMTGTVLFPAVHRDDLLRLIAMAERAVSAERRADVIEGVLTVGRLVVRGVPMEHAARCIYILRDTIEDWEREQSKMATDPPRETP